MENGTEGKRQGRSAERFAARHCGSSSFRMRSIASEFALVFRKEKSLEAYQVQMSYMARLQQEVLRLHEQVSVFRDDSRPCERALLRRSSTSVTLPQPLM